MAAIILEQALYGNDGGYRFVARSPGFTEDWLTQAEQLCTSFGDRPAGVTCPACVFAQPFGKHHVAIVQVADQGSDDAGRPGALGFYLVILLQDDYAGLGGDPFAIAERCPPRWEARDVLPTLSWPAEPLPPRTVPQVQAVLRREEGPTLLGGAQVLVDGGRVVFARPVPDTLLLHSLWTLLPTRTRSTLWPASFAFGNALGFDALVVPGASLERAPAEFPHYVSEEEAGDYPTGRYEMNLQAAAEAGDQAEVDRLFARRSRAEMWRLGLVILALAIVLPLLVHWLAPPPAVAPDTRTAAPQPVPATLPPPALPAHELPLNAAQHERLLEELRAMSRRTGVRAQDRLTAWPQPLMLLPAPGVAFPTNLPWSVAIWADPAEMELAALDQRLGTPDPQRVAGSLAAYSPVARQLRILLWKHGIGAHGDPRLNALELLERLQANTRPREGP